MVFQILIDKVVLHEQLLTRSECYIYNQLEMLSMLIYIIMIGAINNLGKMSKFISAGFSQNAAAFNSYV